MEKEPLRIAPKNMEDTGLLKIIRILIFLKKRDGKRRLIFLRTVSGVGF